MFKCRECGYVFEEPGKYSEDMTPGGVCEGGSVIQHQTACPLCGGAYDEAVECGCCGEYYFDEELTDTTEFVNGGCGKCCDQCIIDGGMEEIWDSIL